MKVIIATGGSGGHIFPALNVAEELSKLNCEINFVGVFGDIKPLIEELGYPVKELSAKGLVSNSLFSIINCTLSMLKSTLESLKALNIIKPNAVIGFGGYGAFPMVFTAAFCRYPTMIHEQNVLPGRANKLLAKLVKKIAISFENSKKYFHPQKTVLTGCPCKRLHDNYNKNEILKEFKLEKDKFTLLILGGSQGSNQINEVLLVTLQQLENKNLQVIHVTGKANYDEVKSRYETVNITHCVIPFLNEIDKAYYIADGIMSRAGAVTINEIAAFGLRAILVPYPYAGGHQKENAVLLKKIESAVVIEEDQLTPQALFEAIIALQNQTVDRSELINRGRVIYKSNAANALANEIITIASC